MPCVFRMTVGKIYNIELTTYPGTLYKKYTFIDDTGSRYYQCIYDLSKDYIPVQELRDEKIEQILNNECEKRVYRSRR